MWFRGIGTLCIFAGHLDRVIILGAIKVFPLTFDTKSVSVAGCAQGRKHGGGGGGGKTTENQLIATHVERPCPGDVNKATYWRA